MAYPLLQLHIQIQRNGPRKFIFVYLDPTQNPGQNRAKLAVGNEKN